MQNYKESHSRDMIRLVLDYCKRHTKDYIEGAEEYEIDFFQERETKARRETFMYRIEITGREKMVIRLIEPAMNNREAKTMVKNFYAWLLGKAVYDIANEPKESQRNVPAK